MVILKTMSRVPYKQWLASKSKEEIAEYYKAKAAKANVQKGSSYYRPAVRGRGAYSTAPRRKRVATRKVPNKAANDNFSSDYGARLGAVVGEGIQSFANAIGFGEYEIQQNSCLTMIDMGTTPPRVKNSKSGEATIIHHREYITDISSGTGATGAVSNFKLQTFEINPGNSDLFPFAARIAQNFQEYEVRGVLFELKSLSSDYASAVSLGSMFCAVDYNALNNAPTTKQQLENLEYACSEKPSKSIIMPLECARKNDVLTHLYVSVDNEYHSGDARLYDIGKLHVGSAGIPTQNTPIAELWVTYEIALFKPTISQ